MSFEYTRLSSIGNQCKFVAENTGASLAQKHQKTKSKCCMIGVRELAPAEHVERVGRLPTYDFSSCFFPKFKIMHFQNRDIKLYTVVLLFLCFLKFLLKLCCR